MTPDQIEDVIERTATRTAEKLREEFSSMLSGLGFNMDPDKRHEEQQMIAFARNMHRGTWVAFRAGAIALITALIGWMVYPFIGKH